MMFRNETTPRGEAQGQAHPTHGVGQHDEPGGHVAQVAEAVAQLGLDHLHVQDEVDALDGQGDAQEDAQQIHGGRPAQGGRESGHEPAARPVGGLPAASAAALLCSASASSSLVGEKRHEEGGRTSRPGHQAAQDQQGLGPGQGRLERNRKPAATAPRLPPAPTIPATEPSAFLLMKGTTEIGRAFGHLHEQAEDDHGAGMASGSTAIREKTISARPSTKSAMKSQLVTRPRRPPVRPKRSPMMPPSGAGEDVHQPEQARDQAGGLQAQVEVVHVVEGRDVVDRQLDAEAGP